MLAAWYKKQMENKAREEERRAWQKWLRELQDWEQQREEAESVGRTFDEPPPAPPAGD